MGDDRTAGTGGRRIVDEQLRSVLDDGTADDTGDNPLPGTADTGLDDVMEVETVSDVVDVEAFSSRLPGGWSVEIELIPFGDDPLAETLLVRRNLDDPRLLLRPSDLADPRGQIECYERRRSSASSEQIVSTDSLAEAVRVATNWVHQQCV